MTSDVLLLAVRVKPRAKRIGLLGWHGEALKVGVRAAPERGRANEELLEILSEVLGVPRSALAIAAGATSQDKRVQVAGLDARELRRRIDAALAAE